jgi:hypothetical protein
MLKEVVAHGEMANVHVAVKHGLSEDVVIGRAHGRFVTRRPKNWITDPATGLLIPDIKLIPHWSAGPAVMVPDPDCYDLIYEDEYDNLITNAGRQFLHNQGYGTTGLGANGLNYIALSNDTVTETATSTTLSNEITINGLGRAQGTVTLPTGSSNQTTIDKVFTASGAQSAQKAALFTAGSAGTMNHVLGFTQRSLISGDTLEITYTITLG